MIVSTVHLVATLLMAGVILFVQVVHYPLMDRVGPNAFAHYEEGHTRRTSWVVVPLMSLELLSASWLAVQPPSPEDRAFAYLGVGLLVVIWGSTAVFQGPAHGRLLSEFDRSVHRRLVTTNWIRTIAWGARIPVAVALMG